MFNCGFKIYDRQKSLTLRTNYQANGKKRNQIRKETGGKTCEGIQNFKTLGYYQVFQK